MLKQMYVGFIDPLARIGTRYFLWKEQGILQPMYSQMAPSKVKENAQKQKRRRKTYKRFTYI